MKKGMSGFVLILGIFVLAVAVQAGKLQTIYEVHDYTRCPIDSAKSFSPMPDKILVELPDWEGTSDNTYIQNNIDGKIFTASSLRNALVYYQTHFCTPIDSDSCTNQRLRATRITSDMAVTVASSTLIFDDGLYYNNVKVLKGDQQFIANLPSLHPMFLSNTKYIGQLYGVDSAEQLKCTANYGIDMTLPRTDTITTTTTTPSQTTTTRYIPIPSPQTDTITQFINSIIQFIKNIFRI